MLLHQREIIALGSCCLQSAGEAEGFLGVQRAHSADPAVGGYPQGSSGLGWGGGGLYRSIPGCGAVCVCVKEILAPLWPVV